jgi:drug/metabolite transporter (DMT)-like permease
MKGEYFGVITAIFWAVGIFPFALSTMYFSATHMNLMRLMLALLLLSPCIMLAEGISFHSLFSSPGYTNWLWLGLSGIIGLALGDYFSFSSFRAIGAKNSSIFSTLAPGSAILFGYLLLGETINLIGLGGILTTVFGIIYISLQQRDSGHAFNLAGMGYAIGAALCQGAGLILAKKAYENNPIEIIAFHAAWIRIFASVVTLFIFSLLTGEMRIMGRNAINPENRKGLLYMFLGTLIGTVMGLSFAMQTVSSINGAVAQTIFSLVPVFAIPLAYLFHKEKITLPIILGALIAIAGVIILIWREAISAWFNL